MLLRRLSSLAPASLRAWQAPVLAASCTGRRRRRLHSCCSHRWYQHSSIDDARAAHAAALELGRSLQRTRARRAKEAYRGGGRQHGGELGLQVARQLEELESTLSLCELAADEQEVEVLDQAVCELHEQRVALREHLLNEALMDPETGQPSPSRCFLEFQAAPGGGDTCYWLDRLLTMYTAWAAQQPTFSSQVIAKETPFGQQEYVGGYRSACMELSGPQIAGWLRSEDGVHCFKHVTPFGKNQVKQTGFVRVTVVPVVEDRQKIAPVFQKNELRVSTMRASGPGGQHVNTTESAVRIVHEPSGISVRVSASRSQPANKALAMTLLENKIRAAIAAQELSASRCVPWIHHIWFFLRTVVVAAIDSQKHGLCARAEPYDTSTFGAQIRTYRFLPPAIVHDHRTNAKHRNPDGILNDAEGLTDLMQGHLLSTI
jgi:peptide chain release factor 2